MIDMDEPTLKALKACIEKYETVASAPTEDLKSHKFNWEECQLCVVTGGMCGLCPVGIDGHPGCSDTPWDVLTGDHELSGHSICAVARYARKVDSSPSVVEHLRERCQAEAEYLKTLLPKDEP